MHFGSRVSSGGGTQECVCMVVVVVAEGFGGRRYKDQLCVNFNCGHSVSSTSTIHTCDVWTNLFVPYQPVQSQTKPSLGFVVSTTHSMVAEGFVKQVCIKLGRR